MDRRTFLRSAAVTAGAVAALRAPWSRELVAAASQPLPPPFAHGVASGDPLPDGIILWTRVTPTADAQPGSGRGPAVDVDWVVATDPALRDVVRRGTVRTDSGRDHTVKLDVRGLRPATRYFYAFSLGTERSIVGAAVTAPAAGMATRGLRFALASCSNFEGGHFAAYRGIAERTDLDFVLHVGDYIYEYEVGYYGAGPDIGREHKPRNEILTLADYRQRYACYREDPDLRAAHAAHPFILMWDDHEVANDNWEEGAENHDPESQGDFRARYDRASRAYREWLPVRENPDDPQQLYRRLELGDLATLHMIDSRSYRSEQTSLPITPETNPDVDDPDRTMLGGEQKAWFKDGLSRSRATWQLVGNPQMIAPVLFPPLPRELTGQIADVTGLLPQDGVGYNSDQWDGYRAARDEILRHLADNEIDNTVFLTGDIHSSWACDLPLNPGGYPLTSPSVATELVGTSITSDNLDEIVGSPPRTTSVAVEEAIKASNRHIKLLEFDSHGFSVVDVTAERTHMDWFYLRSTETPQRPQHDPAAALVYAQSWKVDVGTNRVSRAEGPLPERAGSGAVTRVSGSNRFGTAAAISAATFEPGADVAFVATGEDFPDALAGGVLAALRGAPVLLVTADTIPQETRTELERLEPGRIVVLGGDRAVHGAVVEQLGGFTDGEVSRLAGQTRFHTAAEVAKRAFPDGAERAYVATGQQFPDALAGVPAAFAARGPVLLTARDQVPDVTLAELDRLGVTEVILLGGEGAVSRPVADAIARTTGATLRRLAGPSRTETAIAVSRDTFPDGAETVYVATGWQFPDALAGGAVAAAAGAPVLLVERDGMPSGLPAELRRLGARRAVVLGGTAAVSRNVALAVGDALAR
jgi:alkaline phosphatase D